VAYNVALFTEEGRTTSSSTTGINTGTSTVTTNSDDETRITHISLFYNIYLPPEDPSRAYRIVEEQTNQVGQSVLKGRNKAPFYFIINSMLHGWKT
jgi:hypothetical protein